MPRLLPPRTADREACGAAKGGRIRKGRKERWKARRKGAYSPSLTRAGRAPHHTHAHTHHHTPHHGPTQRVEGSPGVADGGNAA